ITAAVADLFVRPNLLLLQRPNTLRDRARELVAVMKMRVMASVLQDVRESITGSEEHPVATIGNKRLPTVFRLKQIREAIKELQEEFQQRQVDIKSEATDDTVPIVRVWTTGSFDSDLKALVENYRRQKKLQSLADADITETMAWEILDSQIVKLQNPGAEMKAE